jgi:hypothetical protein
MSIYKRRYGDSAELQTLTKAEYALAICHAQAINLGNHVMGRQLHDFQTCEDCIGRSAAYRAVVVLNLNEKGEMPC